MCGTPEYVILLKRLLVAVPVACLAPPRSDELQDVKEISNPSRLRGI
jgi:hypothetical protein